MFDKKVKYYLIKDDSMGMITKLKKEKSDTGSIIFKINEIMKCQDILSRAPYNRE